MELDAQDIILDLFKLFFTIVRYIILLNFLLALLICTSFDNLSHIKVLHIVNNESAI